MYVKFVYVLHKTLYPGCMYLHTKWQGYVHTTMLWITYTDCMQSTPYFRTKRHSIPPLLLVAMTSYFTILFIDTLFYLILSCVYYFITMF